MKQYSKFNLKKLRQSLEMGDVTRCAKDLDVSTVTVQAALKGDGMTATHRRILDHLEYMVMQSFERKARILEAGKAEFKRQKEANQ